MRVVLEPTESEVRQQGAADGLVESCRQAVIMNLRAATQPSDSAPEATQADAQPRLSGEAVVSPSVTPEDMKIPGRLVVAADIERVAMEWSRTRDDKVIGMPPLVG